MRLQEWLWRWGMGGRGNTTKTRGSGLNYSLKYIQEQSGSHFHKRNCSSFIAVFNHFASQRDGLSETLSPECPQHSKKTKRTTDLHKYKVHTANYSLLKASPGNLCPMRKIYCTGVLTEHIPVTKALLLVECSKQEEAFQWSTKTLVLLQLDKSHRDHLPS